MMADSHLHENRSAADLLARQDVKIFEKIFGKIFERIFGKIFERIFGKIFEELCRKARIWRHVRAKLFALYYRRTFCIRN